jgi:hypothetical protein
MQTYIMECNKTHVYDELFEALPKAKQHYTRILDQCAGCAYDAGYADGFNGRLHNLVVQSYNTVPPNKYPKDKIKDPIHAYDMGFAVGNKERLAGAKKKKWYDWFLRFWGYIFGKKKKK